MSRPSFAGFADELVKISGAGLAGALIGGGAASMLPGNKIRNGIIGGAIGGVVGKGVGAVKRHLIDPNHHRNEMLANQQAPGDPNYIPTWQQGYR